MPKSIAIAHTVTPEAKGQNVKWFTTDKPVNDLGKFRFNIAVNSAVVVEYTVDGTTWIKINGGVALIANCSYGFDIYVRAGDLLNLRTPNSGGTTVLLGRLDSIKDEG